MSTRPIQRVTLTAADGSATFVFDATTSESYSHKTTLTKHPVETGADIADHAIDMATTLAFDVVMSNTPLLLTPSQAGGQGQGAFQKFYEEIVRFKARHVPVAVVTGVVTPKDVVLPLVGNAFDAFGLLANQLPNFIITEVTLRREPKTGDAGDFAIALEEVRFVTTDVLQRSATSFGKVKKEDKGKYQPKKPKEDAQPDDTLGNTAAKGIGKAIKVDLTTRPGSEEAKQDAKIQQLIQNRSKPKAPAVKK